jgi:hypothetical protein
MNGDRSAIKLKPNPSSSRHLFSDIHLALGSLLPPSLCSRIAARIVYRKALATQPYPLYCFLCARSPVLFFLSFPTALPTRSSPPFSAPSLDTRRLPSYTIDA